MHQTTALPSGSTCLIICEKPSVARELFAVVAGGIGKRHDGYISFDGGFITWCFGHLLELKYPDEYKPEWKNWDFSTLPMVPEGFGFQFKPKDGDCNRQLRLISSLMSKVDYLVNACDAGREGELIWWETVRHNGWGKDLKP